MAKSSQLLTKTTVIQACSVSYIIFCLQNLGIEQILCSLSCSHHSVMSASLPADNE